jgi:ferric-dicitrate binding protein FerR (iron transport regulator)
MNPPRMPIVPGRVIVSSILILMTTAGLCFGLEAASSTVTVAYVEGEATLTPAGHDTSVALAEDRVVGAGDRIDTGKNGSVELVLPDDSAVRVGPESRIVVKEAGYVEVTKKSSNVLSLVYGKIRAVVAPFLNTESEFFIETENATVGVRGTDFVVSHDKAAKETDVLCSDGSVELRPKDIVRKGLGPILVRGDEGIRLIAGRLPERPGRWIDDNRLRMIRNLDFKGKRTKKIMELRLKYLQNKGESAVDTLKSGGNTLKNSTNRTIRNIFRR